MALVLYAHNAKAYAAACEMMDKYGMAAIVHPTGTGKSYIAFKLIEDHPNEAIFWLSPSEYIFKTQRESLLHQDPDYSLQNVHFYTFIIVIINIFICFCVIFPVIAFCHQLIVAVPADQPERNPIAFPCELHVTSLHRMPAHGTCPDVSRSFLCHCRSSSLFSFISQIVSSSLQIPKYSSVRVKLNSIP